MLTRYKDTAQPHPVSEHQDTHTAFSVEQLDGLMVAALLEEAQDLLDSARELLDKLLSAPTNRAVMLALQHDLDMLQGGAELAGVQPIAAVAHQLKFIYEGLLDERYSCNEALVSLLFRSYDCLAVLFDQLQAGQALPHPSDIIFRLQTFADAQTETFLQVTSGAAPSAHDQRAHSTDLRPGQTYLNVRAPELVAVFLEEGFEILNHATTALLRWIAHSDTVSELQSLQRYLHTLKGNARMAEIPEIGDLAHKLEFLYEDLRTGLFIAGESVFELLHDCHDALAMMLEAVRDKTPLPDGQLLMGRIQRLRAQQRQLNTLQTSGNTQAAAQALPQALAAQLRLEKFQQAKARTLSQPLSAEHVRVSADVLEELVALADETAVFRSHIEQHVHAFGYLLNDMSGTVEAMREQLQRLDTQIERSISSRELTEPDAAHCAEADPLKIDFYAHLQQLSRALFASSSDLLGLQDRLTVRHADTQTLLLQKSRVNTQLQESLLRTRLVPLEHVVPRLQRVVRKVSSELGKRVHFIVANAQGKLDRYLLERMLAPLEHMLRNALDHGIEPAEMRYPVGKPSVGTIHLELSQEGTDSVLILSDDGAGIDLPAVRQKALEQQLITPDCVVSDQEMMQFILQPGLSTAEKVTQISGRGFGMDVVMAELQRLGGSIRIDSLPGEGTRFYIRLPLAAQ